MFYVVYNKADNVVLRWHNDHSVGIEFPTAAEYKAIYVRDTKADPATVDVVIMQDPEDPAAVPNPLESLIDPVSLTFSPNPNYVPPEPTPEISG